MKKYINGWTVLVAVLAVVIIAGGIVALAKYRPQPPLEIYITQEPELEGEVYIGGEVANPGCYPLLPGDTLDDLIRAAGGPTDNAALEHIEIHVPAVTEGETSQKVNINRAEAWLLGALPGIGETRAEAIIAYRQSNGPFRHASELLNVEGIGLATYEGIKDLITVAD